MPSHRTSHTEDFPNGLLTKCHTSNVYTCIDTTNEEYLMTSFMTLTGCFLDFLADSVGMGIISGGGISAVRSSSPKMAACCV